MKIYLFALFIIYFLDFYIMSHIAKLTHSLIGKWSFHRIIYNNLQALQYNHLSSQNIVNGIIDFHPININDPICELQYHESGNYQTASGESYEISAFYIYAYESASSINSNINNSNDYSDSNSNGSTIDPTKKDCLHIYFPNDDKISKNRSFLKLYFDDNLIGHGSSSNDNKFISTCANHLCGQDFYIGTYTFNMLNDEVESFKIQFDVKGPNKDYQSVTTLIRCNAI